ncbi:hypothetical protein [Fictibacillus sp. WQ 8-8]|nr:hypothetical protein [Fictibacillus sp. WQ 8-8]
MNYSINHPFTSKVILAISEIGMPVTDVWKAANQLKAALGVSTYHGRK